MITWDERAYPTPEQWCEWVVSISYAERLDHAKKVLDAMQRAHVCFAQEHQAFIDRWHAAHGVNLGEK